MRGEHTFKLGVHAPTVQGGTSAGDTTCRTWFTKSHQSIGLHQPYFPLVRRIGAVFAGFLRLSGQGLLDEASVKAPPYPRIGPSGGEPFAAANQDYSEMRFW